MSCRRISLLAAILCTVQAFAQDYRRSEFYVGYSYVNIDTNSDGNRKSANGWEASTLTEFRRGVGLEVSGSGYYKTSDVYPVLNAKLQDYAAVAGPRLTYKQVFAHALFGADVLHGSASGESRTQTSFASIFGGGVEQPLSSRWAIRGSADYLLTHHNLAKALGFDNGLSLTQSNFRIGVGLVYRFGVSATATAYAASKPATGSTPPTGKAVPLNLVGIVGQRNAAYGFRVTAIAPGSPADQAKIAVGDYIVAVNGFKTYTPEEVEAALGQRTGNATVTINKPHWLSSQTQTVTVVLP